MVLESVIACARLGVCQMLTFGRILSAAVVLQIPLGAGLALYHQVKKDGNVALVSYGDGAANQGQVAEVRKCCGSDRHQLCSCHGLPSLQANLPFCLR